MRIVLASELLVSSGCATVTRWPHLLEQRESRNEVIEKLGNPAAAFVNTNGEKVDIYLTTHQWRRTDLDESFDNLRDAYLGILTLGLYGFIRVIFPRSKTMKVTRGRVLTYDASGVLQKERSTVDSKSIAKYGACVKKYHSAAAPIKQFCTPLIQNVFWSPN